VKNLLHYPIAKTSDNGICCMNNQQILKELKEHYFETVKPLMKEGSLDMASIEMSNLIMGYIKPYQEEVFLYHSGKECWASAKVLEKCLKDNDASPTAIQKFEAYLNQLELSVNSGNRRS
jgi:hypothetical protein